MDERRRVQLRNHHTATHIVFAASRQVLGPHVWQNGAKKTEQQAHLDITHFGSVSKEQELQIQDAANRIVMRSVRISKGLQQKDQAEKRYGFTLYQGGVIPGNTLRIVEIEGVDAEACCGTHCDLTSEVGWIKLITSKRIADGIVRLYFVAGERALQRLNEEALALDRIGEIWSFPEGVLVQEMQKVFKEYKGLKNEVLRQSNAIFETQVRYALDVGQCNRFLFRTEEDSPTLFFSVLPSKAPELVARGKSVVFLGETFCFGFFSEQNLLDKDELRKLVGDKGEVSFRSELGKKKHVIKDILMASVVSRTALPDLRPFFSKLGFRVVGQ